MKFKLFFYSSSGLVGNGLESAPVKLRETEFSLSKRDFKLANLLKGSLIEC